VAFVAQVAGRGLVPLARLGGEIVMAFAAEPG
jgi:hypothetical protein